jgi:succinate dehydrogenase hydrophobic anchor subunit
MLLTILILVYLLIAVLTYFFYFKNDEAHTTFEKIWLSVFWIVLPFLALIHKLNNLSK